MIARWKDFTIANIWLKPRFTTNDDIRLGSVNEAPKFFFLSTNKFIATILRLVAWDWIGCIFLDDDEESSGVGRGVLHGDSSLLVIVISESSITESNKVLVKNYIK